MSTLRPNIKCWIQTSTKTFDGNGRVIHKTRRRQTKCAIVSIYTEEEKTTVRADSSASRGQAEETLEMARLLFKPRENLCTGDVVEVDQGPADNIKVEIKRIFRRPDVNGVIHHIDAEGQIWASS